MKLPLLVRNALSHRCGYMHMRESNKNPLSSEDAYWYMYDGHAEIVAAYIKELQPDAAPTDGVIYTIETGDTWDKTRPIQINIVELAKLFK